MAAAKVWIQRLLGSYRQILRDLSSYRKYGLRAHDLITDQDPDVAEAIKKLPEEEYQLRLERLRRALDLSMKHRILPRNQWTTPEQDIDYLAPYIKQARDERLERENWDE